MKLLVIRHAIALDRDAWAEENQSDELRPLAPKGVKRMAEQARGLSAVIERIDVIFTSPLVRAAQTTEILKDYFPGADCKVAPSLAPGIRPVEVFELLRSVEPQATVAVVGHEPDLSQLIALSLVAASERFVQLKKGSACLIEFDNIPAPGRGVLSWYLPPAALRLMEPPAKPQK